MIFKIETNEPRIKLACQLAHDFFELVARDKIEIPESFTHTTMTSEQVRLHIAMHLESSQIPVSTYRTRSKIVGRFFRGRIEYNIANLLSHDNAFIAGNMVHEALHYMGYVHKGNFRNRNRNWLSVPYALGDLCRDWCSKNQ